MSNSRFSFSTFISLCIIASTGCVNLVGAAEREGNVSTIFGKLEVSTGKMVRDVSSVNGGVALSDYVEAQRVNSVNGNINVGEFVSVDSLQTVNGDIEAGRNLQVSQDVHTINGSVNLKNGSSVSQDIATINGHIILDNVTVGGNVETQNGNIALADNSLIRGDLVFHQQHQDPSNWQQGISQLSIDASSFVSGRIILEREVSLNIADPELLDRVIKRYQYGK